MKSDPHFYKIFKACPELFAVFVPMDMEEGYRFDSQAYKEIDRTYDGIFEPLDKKSPTLLVFTGPGRIGLPASSLLGACHPTSMDQKKGLLLEDGSPLGSI